MSVGEYCTRDVVIVEMKESVREVIKLMRERHVGDVVVVEPQNGLPIPQGILTDRDIVIEILAEDVDPMAITVGDVMSYEPITVTEEKTILEALNVMRNKGVRRLLVVNQQGGLEGILSVDDILELIAEQMNNIVVLISQEINHEEKLR